jgi:hypothetical protein
MFRDECVVSASSTFFVDKNRSFVASEASKLINSIIRLPEPGKRQEPSQLRFERPVDVKEIVVNLEQHDRERVIEGCSWRSLVIARGQRQYSRLGSDLGKEVRKQNFQGVCRKAE